MVLGCAAGCLLASCLPSEGISRPRDMTHLTPALQRLVVRAGTLAGHNPTGGLISELKLGIAAGTQRVTNQRLSPPSPGPSPGVRT